MFDDPALRPNLGTLYNEEKSLMTFEGQQIFGRTKILEKIQGLGFQKICHSVTIIDCQPMFDGGILISVLGQLKTDDDPAHTFNQVFVLKPIADSFYVEHDVFRLALHHTAWKQWQKCSKGSVTPTLLPVLFPVAAAQSVQETAPIWFWKMHVRFVINVHFSPFSQASQNVNLLSKEHEVLGALYFHACWATVVWCALLPFSMLEVSWSFITVTHKYRCKLVGHSLDFQ